MAGRRWCAALNCRSRLSREDARGISYFTFPLRNEELLQKWLNNFNRKDFKPSENLHICSLHFRDEDFIEELQNNNSTEKTTSGGPQIRLLKPEAVPTIFHDAPSPSQGVRQQYINRKQRIWPCLGCGKIYGCSFSLRKHLFKFRCHDRPPVFPQQSQDEDWLKMEESACEAETVGRHIKQEVPSVYCPGQGSLSLGSSGEICSAIVKEEEEGSNEPLTDPRHSKDPSISVKTEPLDPDVPSASSSIAYSAIETEEVEKEDCKEPVKEGKRWLCGHPGCSRVQGYLSRLGALRHMGIAHPDSYPSRRQRLNQCSLCGERFTNRNDSAAHAAIAHNRRPKRAIFHCRGCRTPFKSLKTAEKCELQHEKGTVECPHCPSRFSVRYLLVRHLEGFHKRPGFPCMECRRDFSTNSDLIAHFKGSLCGGQERNLELMGMILVCWNKRQ